jgi:transposase
MQKNTLNSYEFIKQSEEKQIDLVYFDQAGFTLTPCIPYAWQAIGTTIEIPCFHSKRLNVLGFMNRDCVFQSMVFECSISSSIVVECINIVSKSITIPTVLVMDNASIHTSYEFTKNIDIWKKQGLTIYNIARYSPELNLIEILWRKIKYEWLPFSSYNSFDDLKNNLFEILANIGKSYVVNF